ncbi:glycosyltransferase family 9 protein [Rhodospirillum sp. A1_3_36]|uniref:glycosyltransferase family 9 protein n=1 Tax=Rhodospirillum sp. A1_3_36 TaxID=3391666 RepID=UPI0039A71C45
MKLLFITSTRIGDAVLSTGLLDHIIRSTQGVRVTVACGPAAAGLFEAVPGLERLHVLRKGPWARHWRGLWRACVTTRWDVIVDLRMSAVSWLVSAKRRHVYRAAGSREHKVVQMARVLGVSPPPAPRIWLGADNQARAESVLPPRGTPLLALGPVANWVTKTWPAGHFVELARRLTAPGGPLPGAPIVLLGGPGEREAIPPLRAALSDLTVLDLVGEGSLLDAQAVLERCALFVGNDSGLMHMAAASGIPTLGLFGPSPDHLYGPWGPKTALVRTPQSFEEIMPPGTDPASVAPVMHTLTVDAVEQAALRLWERHR